MKINAISIFGLCIAGAGILFLIFAVARGGGGSASPGAVAESGGWGAGYYLVAAGIILCGVIIAFTGQLMRKSPKPTDPL